MTDDDDGFKRRREEGYERQLVLDLAREPSYDPDEFLVSASNADAYAAVAHWPVWSTRTLLIVGPPGSGKSHLGAIWAARARAQTVTVSQAAGPQTWDGPVVAFVDDCGGTAYDQASLFHLINIVGETNGWLLMTAQTTPAAWSISIPDLRSRLRLAHVVEIHQPDAELIKAVVVKLFADRQILVDDEVINYAALHCDRSLAAIGQFVTAVDNVALATGRRITRSLASKALARLALRPIDEMG